MKFFAKFALALLATSTFGSSALATPIMDRIILNGNQNSSEISKMKQPSADDANKSDRLGRTSSLPNPDNSTVKIVETLYHLPVHVEDGATFNLRFLEDGTPNPHFLLPFSVTTASGIVVPIESKNMQREEITVDEITKFISDNIDKIDPRQAHNYKVGLYKFPKDETKNTTGNEMSIDLNLLVSPQYKDQALTFAFQAGQESLFDLGTFKNLKTGEDGQNPASWTAEEFKQIAAQLSEGKIPDVNYDKARLRTRMIEDIKNNVHVDYNSELFEQYLTAMHEFLSMSINTTNNMNFDISIN